MNIFQSIKFRAVLVFVGLILASHVVLWTIGELFFDTVLWVFAPFFGLYMLLNQISSTVGTAGCNEMGCGPSMLGWFAIAFNVILTFAICYYVTRYIIRRFLKKGSV
jgi:hypothetical protein